MADRSNVAKEIESAGQRLLQEIKAAGKRSAVEGRDVKDYANGLLEKGRISPGTMWQLGWYVGCFVTWRRHGEAWPLTEEDAENWHSAIRRLITELQSIRE